MSEICIRWKRHPISENQWWRYSRSNERAEDNRRIKEYHKWIRENILPKHAHIRERDDLVIFESEYDLSTFTLIHGKVYDIVNSSEMFNAEMDKINKMILHESVLETCRNESKD